MRHEDRLASGHLLQVENIYLSFSQTHFHAKQPQAFIQIINDIHNSNKYGFMVPFCF